MGSFICTQATLTHFYISKLLVYCGHIRIETLKYTTVVELQPPHYPVELQIESVVVVESHL